MAGARGLAIEEPLRSAVSAGRRRAQSLLDIGVPRAAIYERLRAEAQGESPSPSRPGTRQHIDCEVSDAPTRGPRISPVEVVFFSNFACASCAAVAATLKRLEEAHRGTIRLVWKNRTAGVNPQLATLSAELAVAAHRAGRFWALYDRVFANPKAVAKMDRADLEALAERAGMDPVRLKRDLEGHVNLAAVEREQDEATRLGLPGAPVVLVNGLPYFGVVPLELIDGVMRSELERGLLDRLAAAHP
jgi:protein-disulfide isomerase